MQQVATNGISPKAKSEKKSIYPTWHWAWTHPYLMTAFAFVIASTIALLLGAGGSRNHFGLALVLVLLCGTSDVDLYRHAMGHIADSGINAK